MNIRPRLQTAIRIRLIFLAPVMVCGLCLSDLPDDGSGLRLGANVDIVGQIPVKPTSTSPRHKLQVREAELMVYSSIDHLFEGRLSLAAHQEGGQALFEVHEAFLSSSKLIPRSRFRVGQFFLGLGRLNQFHRHDWPFTSAPKVHQTFFGEEAAIDGGIEYSFLAPLPFYLDITAGLMNGWVLGHAHTDGDKPQVPTHYFRVESYVGFPTSGGMQIGLNYLGRKSADAVQTSMWGLDSTLKVKDADGRPYLVQSELWYRSQNRDAQEPARNLGLYVFPSAPVGHISGLSFGVRFDFYQTLGLKDVVGQPIDSHEYSIVPTLTYKTSEFSTFRLNYNLTESHVGGSRVDQNHTLELQAVFILGAHPAHDF